MNELYENCSVAVLCGGKSSRMGYDKAFLEWNGEFLLEKMVQQLKEKFLKIYLVAEKQSKFKQSKLAFSGAEVLEDIYKEMGPLGGICTALERSEQEYVFVVACDMPFFNMELVQYLYSCIENQQVILFEKEGGLETLFAFYHVSCLPVFEQQIKENKRQIRKDFHKLTVKKIPISEKDFIAFTNINTKQELEKWQTIK